MLISPCLDEIIHYFTLRLYCAVATGLCTKYSFFLKEGQETLLELKLDVITPPK